MTRNHKLLNALMQQTPAWIRASMAQPNKYMSRWCILMHAVALRRMGEL